MSGVDKINANPTVYSSTVRGHSDALDDLEDDGAVEGIDSLEVFELVRHLNDPEHPLTLEQLHVTSLDDIIVDNGRNTVDVFFTPTIPHCSMATLIGLCIRVKLLRALPPRFKVNVRVSPGSHSSEAAVNKQLADKERVAAALENSQLLEVVNKCIAHTDKVDDAVLAKLL